MQRIGTVDERFQSYNVEMLEDTPALGRHDRSAGKMSRCTQIGSSALSVQIKKRKSPAINNV